MILGIPYLEQKENTSVEREIMVRNELPEIKQSSRES